MRSMLGPYVSRWSDASLDQLRCVGDPLADAAVSELTAKRGGAATHGVDLVAAVGECARAGSRACRDLLLHVNTVPAWASFPRMALGYRVGLVSPVAAGLALLCGSLPESYAGALGAKVLVRTGNLARSARRRVFETAEFWQQIARSPGGPAPGTSGHRALVQLRLIHAHVRAAIQRRSDWDMGWGLPVNQEDYGATLLTFSLVFARSLQQLGVPMSEGELDSIHHGWRYAGHVMGVDARMLTESRAAEAVLHATIVRRQQHPDADSCALTHALFNEMAWKQPFPLPLQALQSVCRALVGPELADRLSVPRLARWAAIPAATRALHQAQHAVIGAVPGAGRVAMALGTGLVANVIDYGLTTSSTRTSLNRA
jgi:ER-bound oxygenase mpaB/B'/Rubber oxygenase, catalytic domain